MTSRTKWKNLKRMKSRNVWKRRKVGKVGKVGKLGKIRKVGKVFLWQDLVQVFLKCRYLMAELIWIKCSLALATFLMIFQPCPPPLVNSRTMNMSNEQWPHTPGLWFTGCSLTEGSVPSSAHWRSCHRRSRWWQLCTYRWSWWQPCADGNPVQVWHSEVQPDLSPGPFSSILLTVYLVVNWGGKLSEVASIYMNRNTFLFKHAKEISELCLRGHILSLPTLLCRLELEGVCIHVDGGRLWQLELIFLVLDFISF